MNYNYRQQAKIEITAAMRKTIAEYPGIDHRWQLCAAMHTRFGLEASQTVLIVWEIEKEKEGKGKLV